MGDTISDAARASRLVGLACTPRIGTFTHHLELTKPKRATFAIGPLCIVNASPTMSNKATGGTDEEVWVREAIAEEPDHVQLYAYAVSHPIWTADEAAAELGLSLDAVTAAQDTLVQWRLLQPLGKGSHFTAVSPDIAAADRTHDDMERIRELTAGVDRARTELARLSSIYVDARARREEHDADFEVIESPEAVTRIIYEAAGRCRERGYILHPRVAFRAEAHEASKSYDRELVERGVDRRNLYHEGTMSNAATRRVVAELAPLGVQFRVLPAVPVHAIIYDDDLAILSRRHSPTDRAALVIRHPDMVALTRLVFETLWDHAAPFLLDAETPESASLSDVHGRILRGLAAGLTDEVIARRNGMHVRTLRRHLTGLEEQAGVASRFQLALRAKELGWL